MLKDSKHDYLFSPPGPVTIEIQLSSLAREAKLIASDPAVISHGIATLQTPGDSQEDCHRSTEVLMAFVMCLRKKLPESNLSAPPPHGIVPGVMLPQLIFFWR